MLEVAGDHNSATYARPPCLAVVRMASKVQGVIRDYPVRLRLKYRVRAPE
jgi:hypothetical protein